MILIIGIQELHTALLFSEQRSSCSSADQSKRFGACRPVSEVGQVRERPAVTSTRMRDGLVPQEIILCPASDAPYLVSQDRLALSSSANTLLRSDTASRAMIIARTKMMMMMMMMLIFGEPLNLVLFEKSRVTQRGGRPHRVASRCARQIEPHYASRRTRVVVGGRTPPRGPRRCCSQSVPRQRALPSALGEAHQWP